MPDLFPDNMNYSDDTIDVSDANTEYKGSYKFDFDKGEFVKNADGSIAKCNAAEAYKQWCQLAMSTPVGLLGYSNLFGHELNTLAGTPYSKGAVELEVKRMTIEALMVNPKTKDVTDFSFTWQNNGELYYNYTAITTDDISIDLNNTVKVG
ncbi:MAG: DUF2634 domain-containing protein [Clostridium tyrobutyricum]|jgi:hypothetical protein|uniref:DUF2634 domain-containing protein n=1 Tax=Clostridium tyrobutyricum TaxID=1519 RepID=UPI0024333347|nr:DUF2634 domain-containing protein [Clostridium tyrobutyricum]MCH4199285.1 DUF2634 domain-containing protein [Clostridium tyrobutyricum]MCH4236617.1 DUF2634 domain-containing protein [Clostridium tyrobutyricum]MCH4258067.1 DUF2634 domain-containing protein [Clostridium tyrobutyricum]MCI1239106.1 DUF2634 domain-containing protein [Clostridium tyrobutyricum]MCI1651422.1 DUF2634 domain-containing protein [Clostridium tyrobutyricum]